MTGQKRVFIIGGTGFLGYHAAMEFLKRDWSVTAFGLPPAPPTGLFPKSVHLVIMDLESASDSDLSALMKGHHALVFAAGMDDRVTPSRPAYPKFHHANVDVCARVLKLASSVGVGRAVLLGSYFAHFDRLWPGLKLAERHPYIRSRVEQERLAVENGGLITCVLELPYIFGDTLGRKPLWYPLVKYIRSTPLVFYPKGGTACITARTVGQAIEAAAERGEAGKCYPIGDENLTWAEMLQRLAAASGTHIRVVTLPTWLVRFGLYGVRLLHWLQRKEGGLDLRYFASLQTAETFIDPQPSQEELGYETGGLDQAFKLTVDACN